MISDEMVKKAEALLEQGLDETIDKERILTAKTIIVCRREQAATEREYALMKGISCAVDKANEMLSKERQPGPILQGVASEGSALSFQCQACGKEFDLPTSEEIRSKDPSVITLVENEIPGMPGLRNVIRRYVIKDDDAFGPYPVVLCDECKGKIVNALPVEIMIGKEEAS